MDASVCVFVVLIHACSHYRYRHSPFMTPQFRLEAWFEDLDAGAVTSVSFAATSQSSLMNNQQARLDFNTPDFVVYCLAL